MADANSTAHHMSSMLTGVAAVLWPILVVGFLIAYQKLIRSLLAAALARVQRGDEIKIGIFTIGRAVGPLKIPASGEHDQHS
jgi:hypothetical protein